jgi:hypothetical protein
VGDCWDARASRLYCVVFGLGVTLAAPEGWA